MKKSNNVFEALLRMSTRSLTTAIATFCVAWAIQGKAQNYPLSNGDASLVVNEGGGGLSDWTENDVIQMDLQSYYYSVGSGPLESIGALSSWTTASETGSSISGSYSNSSVFVTANYQLNNSSSGPELTSLLGIKNLTATNEIIHLYQFSDFALGGNSAGQTIQFVGTGLPYEVLQTGSNGQQMTGTLTALGPLGLASVEEIAGFNDGMQFGLANGAPVSFPAPDNLSATGDVDFAYEVDATVGSDSALSVSELQSVPEPSVVALVTAGMLGIGLLRRHILVFLKK